MIREVLTMARLRAMPPDEAAAVWTIRLAEGELAHEQELFAEWLALAPGNRDAWERAQRGWTLFDSAEDDELLEEMRRHARTARPASHQNWKKFAAAAAALLVVVSGSILVNRGGIVPGETGSSAGPGNAPPVVAASQTFESGRELPKLITLSDGTRLTLDAQSRVIAQFTADQRNIKLVSGRAFLDVRHDSSRPLTVRAADLRVVDIGTKFDVELAAESVRVELLEGRLSVTSPRLRAPLVLSPGERLTAKGGSRPVVAKVPSDSSLGWQNGFATFDDIKLSEAAAVLNRYPGPTLVVRDPRVSSLRVSGNFRLGDAERFGRTIEQIYPVRLVRRSDAEVEIVPAG